MTEPDPYRPLRRSWITSHTGDAAAFERRPARFADACDFIRQHHRHLDPPRGHKFSLAVHDGHKIAGVVVVGRPVARHLDDGWTVEVTRCCTDGTRNACSKLL